jgi:uncharacterized Zn-binding protein involved in type VI secretion
MPKPAAMMTSLHVCPKFTGPIPHVGGPVIGTGATVLVGVMPAALMGDMAVCVGPPDKVVLGSATVTAMNKPMARMGDNCQHGGIVALGMPTILVDG